MKRRLVVILTLVLMMVPNVVLAAMCSDPTHLINIDGIPNRLLKIQKINTSLSNDTTNGYCKFKNAQDGSCEVCFQMSAPLVMMNTDATKSFAMAIPATEKRGVYVSGLKLSRDNAMVSALPLMNVSNAGEKPLIVNNVKLENVKDGIVFNGPGPLEMTSSTITGDTNKSGACIDVKVNNAVLNGVSVSSCAVGVKVEADNVVVQSIVDGQGRVTMLSTIKENKVGVSIGNYSGTQIISSLIYRNDDGVDTNLSRTDGIRIDGGVSGFEPVLFERSNGKMVEIPDADDVYEFKGKTAYVLLSASDKQLATVEMFVSQDGECGAKGRGQSCGFFSTVVPVVPTRLSVDPEKLPTGPNDPPLQIELPPSVSNKAIVITYTDQTLGTSGFSHAFTMQDGGIVAFVANPYDIPTTSGESDDSGGSQSSGGNESSMGAENGAAAEGVGDSLVSEAGAVGGAAAAGPKCTLMANATFSSSITLDAVWFGIGLCVLATLRAWGSRPRVTVLARSPRNERKCS